MSSSDSKVTITGGNLLASSAQTLVNTVNCVGVMGKGIALAFKREYPEMFQDYVRRCDRREIRLGEPYVYPAGNRLVLNFPTKDHWRAVSRLEDIVAGLEHLKKHYREWGIESLAVPPLGCGNGQLDWEVVGPTLYRHLTDLDIPVELYTPHGVSPQLELMRLPEQLPVKRFVDPEWVAFTALLAELEREPYHWPVGRVFLQKIAYFADQAGLPTGLRWERSSYGPYTPDLKGVVARLQNNGLLVERRRGQMMEVRVGATYRDALETHRPVIQEWRIPLRRALDLVARLDTHRAEVAATVHFATRELAEKRGRAPQVSEVVMAVEEWKVRRNPSIQRGEVLAAILTLATQGWIEVVADAMLHPLLENDVMV